MQKFNRLLACVMLVFLGLQVFTLMVKPDPMTVVVTTNPAVENSTIAIDGGRAAVIEQPGCTATVTARLLNQRSGPQESYSVTGGAARGDILTVSEWSDTRQWVRVNIADGAAWVAARYVRLSGACDQLPVSTLASTANQPVAPAVPANTAAASAVQGANSAATVGDAVATLSPVFTAEVQYWAPQIRAWAEVYGMNPNLIATVIQIESCGDPTVSSSAGAQGLFQVMPFHFVAGEDMLDVATNARRGLAYLQEGLRLAQGDVGMALAGYNGGHGVIGRGLASMAAETRRYYIWGSGIYTEATAGMTVSATLQDWLTAGGSALCNRASQSQRAL